MLFDLRGKRKRVVQVSYSLLALLFLVGFVGFGIGVGGGPGGIFDAIGLTDSSSSGSVSDQFDSEIDDANQKLAKQPDDPKALLQLAENEYFKARTGVTQDQTTGEFSISNEAHTSLGNAADAWQKYLKVNKGKPDPGTAAEMVNVYIFLNDANGAANAQRLVAEDQPSSNSYGTLAIFEYAGGDIAAGDAAREKALAEAPKSQEKSIKTQLESYRKQGVKLQQQQKKAEKQGGGAATTPGGNPLQNPLGGLAPTPAPAP